MTFFSIKHLLPLVLVPALAACGGGSGGGGPVSDNREPLPPNIDPPIAQPEPEDNPPMAAQPEPEDNPPMAAQPEPEDNPPMATEPEPEDNTPMATTPDYGSRIDPSLPAPARLSQARPIPGSVSQSSATNNGVTTDQISVTSYGQTTTGPNGQVLPDWTYYKITVSNKGKWSYTDIVAGSPSISREWAIKDNGVPSTLSTFMTNYGSGTVLDPYTNFSNGGFPRVVFHLKRYSNTDYILLGYWTEGIAVTDDLGNTTYPDFGIFVDGSDPFNNSISQLTGNATYQGTIQLGGYITSRKDVTLEYYGDINLNVNFGDSNDLGSIQGQIENLQTATHTVGGSINLERSSINANNSGFFEGNVSGRLDGRNYSGKWGGQFYDNYSTDGKPGIVAGTMAASSGDHHIYGPWYANKKD